MLIESQSTAFSVHMDTLYGHLGAWAGCATCVECPTLSKVMQDWLEEFDDQINENLELADDTGYPMPNSDDIAWARNWLNERFSYMFCNFLKVRLSLPKTLAFIDPRGRIEMNVVYATGERVTLWFTGSKNPISVLDLRRDDSAHVYETT